MNIRQTLNSTAARHANRPAVWVGGQTLSYDRMRTIRDSVRARVLEGRSGVVAIIAERKLPFYAAIFSTVSAGSAYVPINPKWPLSRIERILDIAAPDAVLLDRATAASDLGRSLGSNGMHTLWRLDADAEPDLALMCERKTAQLRRYDLADLAYIMFTSGSTGVPKGVPISAANVSAYIDNMLAFVDLSENDRVIQNVELTFDLSVHDMMLCWTAGGMLVVVPEASAPLGPRFVQRLEVTSWLSVPSSAAQSRNMGLIGPDSMPSLRYSFFCGEALPASLAVAWMWAAPHSRVFNLYGPTEATIAFSSFDIGSHSDIPHAIVPLGFPIGTQQMDVSAEGELLLSGSQLSSGYILDEEKTAQSFFKHEGRRWYRTGDRAEFDERYGFIFKGRLDSQIKVRGYRVETGEVEVALRKAVGSDLVAVLPVREVGPNTYEGLIGVVCGGLTDMEAARVALREILPEYMCPEKVIAVPDMPKNSNDKVDYIALKTMLSGQV